MSALRAKKRAVRAKAGSQGGQDRKVKGRSNARTQKRERDEAELADLEKRLQNFDLSKPPVLFTDLPVSSATLRGLRSASYTTLTPIQALSLPQALQGKDLLGAARTGSGKTLAFLIPVLECLLRARWGPKDGLGALVISPTRELAVQIFEVLRKIGAGHSFSAGLVIGGKGLEDERERLSRMNILVATPGRLQQHLEQTSGFGCDNLQILVLDEADRILDMGFSKSLNAIIDALPTSRQTLLFSATQTRSVKDLARLSLQNPEYVAAREQGVMRDLTTPKELSQHYMVVPLNEKVDYLWSFVRTHLKTKIIVFLSSCKQVRFVYETFRHLRPGIPLLHLHGKQKQQKRLEIYSRFAAAPSTCLFATDVAARGLDFPAVDWVVQFDCPEDIDAYVHRAGRTARYNASGKALTFLLPSEEEGMLKRWKERGIEVPRVKPNAAKKTSITKKLQSQMFHFPEVKFLGQRAFVSYVRSIYLQKDKEVFKPDIVETLPLEEFAEAIGLPGAPKVRFLGQGKEKAQAAERKKEKNRERRVEALKVELKAEAASSEVAGRQELGRDGDDSSDDESESSSEDGSSEGDDTPSELSLEVEDEPTASTSTGDVAAAAAPKPTKPPQPKTKYERMFQRKNQNVLSDHYAKVLGTPADDDDGDDLLTLKRCDHALDEATLPESAYLSKRAIRAGTSKKTMAAKRGLGEKLVFDEEGHSHPVYEIKTEEEFKKGGDANEQARRWAEKEAERVRAQDQIDREIEKEKRTEKKRKRKGRDRENDYGTGPGAVIAGAEDTADDGYVSPDLDGIDLPPLSEEEARSGYRPETQESAAERNKKKRKKDVAMDVDGGVDGDGTDLEAMALRALASRR